MTRTHHAALAAAIALLSATAAGAADISDPHPFPQEMSGGLPLRVPFAGFSGISGWRVDSEGALLIRTAGDRYYRATFAAACPELSTALSIGFVTEAAGPLDRWSSIYVDGDRCWFKTFVPVTQTVFEGA